MRASDSGRANNSVTYLESESSIKQSKVGGHALSTPWSLFPCGSPPRNAQLNLEVDVMRRSKTGKVTSCKQARVIECNRCFVMKSRMLDESLG